MIIADDGLANFPFYNLVFGISSREQPSPGGSAARRMPGRLRPAGRRRIFSRGRHDASRRLQPRSSLDSCSRATAGRTGQSLLCRSHREQTARGRQNCAWQVPRLVRRAEQCCLMVGISLGHKVVPVTHLREMMEDARLIVRFVRPLSALRRPFP